MIDDEDDNEPRFEDEVSTRVHIEPKMTSGAWERPKAGKRPRPGSVRWFRVMAATHSKSATEAAEKIEPTK